MGVSSVKHSLQLHLSLIGRDYPEEAFPEVVCLCYLPDYLTWDPCCGVGHGIDRLMQGSHGHVQTFYTGQGIMLYIRLFLRRESGILIPLCVIVPVSNSFLMRDFQIGSPFFKLPLSQRKGITEDQSAAEFNEKRIMRISVELMQGSTPGSQEILPEEYPVIGHIMDIYDRLVSGHVHDHLFQSPYTFRRFGSVQRDYILFVRSDADGPCYNVVLTDGAGSLLACLRIQHDHTVII